MSIILLVQKIKSIGAIAFELCVRTDTQTHARTHRQTDRQKEPNALPSHSSPEAIMVIRVIHIIIMRTIVFCSSCKHLQVNHRLRSLQRARYLPVFLHPRSHPSVPAGHSAPSTLSVLLHPVVLRERRINRHEIEGRGEGGD